jgi:uncharacterized protein YdiU (UPF0061 family)
MLGDGRAIHLGEYLTPSNKRVDFQLKGAGPTPYSRRGDGRGTYSSMLREFLISEAVFALGIPSTRSLAVIRPDESVYREEEYPMGILTRIASSHIRVGTFEYGSRIGQPKSFEEFTNYVIRRHYPSVLSTDQPVLNFFKEVMRRQIKLVNQWLSVGFIHGVMNTDNMSIAGETIDYGPCAFMNVFHPETVYSSIDKNGRYAYQNQKPITHWNLMRLAETLVSLIPGKQEEVVQMLQSEMDGFEHQFDEVWLQNFSKKIGFEYPTAESKSLVVELLKWMEEEEADFTNTFRGLSERKLLNSEVYQKASFQSWLKKWELATKNIRNIESILNNTNPSVIPRNHQVENALWEAQENDNLAPYMALLQTIKKPFESPVNEEYQAPPTSEKGYKTFCGT